MERTILIQHGNLANTVTTPETEINKEGCQSLFELSKKICKKDKYCGLAMNQIPLELIKQHTGYQDYHRIIFLRPEGEESSVTEDTLIVNPQIEIKTRDTYFGLEGCGSVDFGQTLMLVERPADFKLKGLFYMSGMGIPKYEEVESKNLKYFNASQHEIDHLDGKTALDFPNRLLVFDPLNEKCLNIINAVKQVFLPKGKTGMYFSINGRVQRFDFDKF